MMERQLPTNYQTPYLLPYTPEKIIQPTHRIRRFIGERFHMYGTPAFALLSNDAGMNLAQKIGALLAQDIPPNSPPFANGELRVVVPETVEHRDVYLIQSTDTHPNRSLRQHKLQAIGSKGRQANSVTMIDTTLVHARQDRIDQPGAPNAAQNVAQELFGASSHNPLKLTHASKLTAEGKLIVVDVHSTEPLKTVTRDSRGIFRFRRGRYQWANLDSAHVLAPEVAKIIEQQHLDVVVAFPDKGAAKRYGNYTELFGGGTEPIVIKKERPVDQRNVVGISTTQEDTTERVKGRDVIIFDDMIDTGSTLLQAARKFKAEGARSVIAVATHGIFSKNPKQEVSGVDIANDPALDMIFITDTVPPTQEVLNQSKIHLVSIAPLIAETIRRIETKQSIRDLVKDMSAGFETSYMRLSRINRYRRKRAA